ncbi:MAG: caspase family protein [Cyanobacteria bacterium J06632_22]
MPPMKRRHFLQFAGSTLAAMGLSQLDFLTQAERYGRVLAQSTPRKLALLVGINNYDFPGGDLQGCLTDVMLQRELLIHRFGFAPEDILEVSDTADLKPTRDNILAAFQTHLIDQAKDGDVVVFHYSGHGAQIEDLSSVYEASDGLPISGTLVPNDPLPPQTRAAAGKVVVNDINSKTLFMLMRALETDNVTAILDSCHSGGGLRGNSRVRSADSRASRSGATLVASQAALDYQQALLETLGLTEAELQELRRAGIARGVGVGSAQFSQLALDAPFGDFHAGAFTYLLTRYLWQMTGGTSAETIAVNLRRSTRAAANNKNHGQVPAFQFAPGSNSENQPIYFTAPVTGPAEAVVTSVIGQQIGFWLGGVSSQSLDASENDAVFTVLDESRNPIGEVVQTSREGLVAFGKPPEGQTAEIKPGMLLRERIIGLSPNPQLVIGVEPSLGEGMASAEAELNTAFVVEQTGQSRITAAPTNDETTFDYLIGRVTETYIQETVKDYDVEEVPPIGTISLFFPSLEPVPGTYGRVDETAAQAVSRLKPKLKLLLANKVLSSIATTTTELPVSGEIFAASGTGPTVPIALGGEAVGRSVTSSIEPFSAGEEIKIRMVNNHPTQAMYLSCIAIDSEGNMTVFYPARWDEPDDAALVEPEGELVIPRAEDRARFSISGSGYLEVLTLMSTGSLRNALRGLQEIATSRGQSRGYLPLDGDESLSVLGDLLGDVNSLSRGTDFNVDYAEDRAVVDGGAIAAFSTVIEVAE